MGQISTSNADAPAGANDKTVSLSAADASADNPTTSLHTRNADDFAALAS